MPGICGSLVKVCQSVDCTVACGVCGSSCNMRKLVEYAVALGISRALIKMEMYAEGKLCAKGEGLFVAVKEGHPAFHRWN